MASKTVFIGPKQLDAHIAKLCKKHKIKRIVKYGNGRARVSLRVIRHPPIGIDEMAYFVALHEVCHVLIGLEGTRLEREARCWEYALRESIVEPRNSTRQRICACLVRYLYRARVRGWKIPEDDSPYWPLLRWWEPLTI